MLQVHSGPLLRTSLTGHLSLCTVNNSRLFPLLCVVHLPVFLSFSVSLLVSYEVSDVAKRARCFLKSAKVIVSAGNITSLGSANKRYTFI